MKDFSDFKKLMTNEVLADISNEQFHKVSKLLENENFEDPIEEFLCARRSETVSLIFAFLEEYHKWLNN